MTALEACRVNRAFPACFPRSMLFPRPRQAARPGKFSVPKVSPASGPCVDFGAIPARQATVHRGRTVRDGRNQGAGRNGYREHTCVRGTCGGAIRTSGEGTQSSHGHLGLSVVRNRKSVPQFLAVLMSGSEALLRPRHPTRDTGLPTAALSRSRFTLTPEPAPAGRAAPATRRRGSDVIRATPGPGSPAEEFRSRPGRTRPDPRMRLRWVQRGS